MPISWARNWPGCGREDAGGEDSPEAGGGVDGDGAGGVVDGERELEELDQQGGADAGDEAGEDGAHRR